METKIQDEVKRQLRILCQGVVDIVPEAELAAKLKKSIESDRPLKVKLGLDPSAPDVHIGHTVVLQKLRQFQELGHTIQLVIGDFTGRIGDPTGKSKTRKPLTEEQIKANAQTYFDQFGKVIDMGAADVRFNSEWLSKLNFADVLELASKYTVARMLERDDFAKRYQSGASISIHEFFYPLMQGYDSVALASDIELGGTDQTFNLLMGRHIQEAYRMEKQVAMTLPLLEGLDGKQKMSKSLGNYIGITEQPDDMYGKTMSIPDELMLKYFTLTTDLGPGELEQIKNGLHDGSLHPRDAKMRFARTLVRMYHGAASAEEAQNHFQQVFQARALPADMPEMAWPDAEPIWIVALLVKLGFAGTNGEARRLIQSGGVRINEAKVVDTDAQITIADGMVVQVGKRKFARLKK